MRLQAAVIPPASACEHLWAALRRFEQPGQLSWLPRAQWRIRLAAFGNVSLGDAEALQGVFAREAAKLPVLTLRLAAVTPLPEDGDDSVWAGISGDTEGVQRLAALIPTLSRNLGFLLDRRGFSPRVRLGRVTAATTVAYLQELEDALGGYEGPPWEVAGLAVGMQRNDEASSDGALDVVNPLPFATGEDG
ncbi:MAG: 2'-5' RNA ligase family protein [Nocardioidaceae bacterium]